MVILVVGMCIQDCSTPIKSSQMYSHEWGARHRLWVKALQCGHAHKLSQDIPKECSLITIINASVTWVILAVLPSVTASHVAHWCHGQLLYYMCRGPLNGWACDWFCKLHWHCPTSLDGFRNTSQDMATPCRHPCICASFVPIERLQ